MADGNLKTPISRNDAENTTSNVLFVQLADDGGNAVSVTGNALDVNATVTLETAYVDDAAFTVGTDKVNAQGFLFDDTATDSVDEGDIGLARMTANRIMLTTIEDADGDRIAIDGSGYLTTNINGSVTVTATDLDIRDLSQATDSVAIGDGTDIIAIAADGSIAVTDNGTTLSIDDGGGTITVDGAVTVSATDLDIRDLSHTTDSVAIGDGTDTLAINSNGSINTVPAIASSGTEVHDYQSDNLAAAATANHDYTVTNNTFLCTRVAFGGSGRMKVEVQSGPVASLTTKAVRFTQRDTSDDVVFDPPLPVPVTSTGTLRVIKTNRSAATLDCYSTIMGEDIT